MGEKNSALVTNVSWSFLAKIFAMVFFFIADVSYARMLGVEGYAEWAYFFSMCNIAFCIGWMGINSSSSVYISKSEDRNTCLGAALLVRFFVSVLSVVVMAALASPIATIAGYPKLYANLKKLLFIMPVMVFFNSFTDFFKQIYTGTQSYKMLCVITFIEYFSYGLFAVLLLVFFQNPISIAIGYCVGGIVILICNVLIICKEYDTKLVYKGRGDKELQKSITKYAIPLVSASFGGFILTEMDTVMLGLYSTKEQVSLYSVVKSLISKSLNVNMAILIGTVVSLSMITKDNLFEKQTQYKKVSHINNTVSLFICICFLLFGKFAIGLVYGDKFAAVDKIIIGLMPYQLLYSLSSLRANFLDFMGHAKMRAVWFMSVIVINLILNYLLIPVYGALGAAAASSVSLIPYTLYCMYDVHKVFKSLKKQFSYR